MKLNDSASLSDSASATAIYGGKQEEKVQIHGRYEVVCTGPIESKRGLYNALQDEILKAQERENWEYADDLLWRLDGIPTEEKWRDVIDNVVTTVGKNDILDKYLKGAAYTQTFRMGLKGTGAAAAGDTQASHAGWLEVGLANAPTYTAPRKDVVMGAAAAGVSTSPAQVFAMTGSGTVAGCFTNNGGSATIDNTTGVLVSAGDFTAGSKSVTSGDSISVVFSLTLT